MYSPQDAIILVIRFLRNERLKKKGKVPDRESHANGSRSLTDSRHVSAELREHMFAAIGLALGDSRARRRAACSRSEPREMSSRRFPRADRDFSGRFTSGAQLTTYEFAHLKSSLCLTSAVVAAILHMSNASLLLTMREPSESRRLGSDIPHSTRPSSTRDRRSARWPWARPTVF